jgi:outer membrane protein assembly factor BamA
MPWKGILLVGLFTGATATAGAQCDKRVVNDIEIIGLRKTKMVVIERELAFSRGDSLDVQQLDDRIRLTKQNLTATLLFNKVQIQKTEAGCYTDFVIIVQERWYLWPELILKHADTNFNTWWQTRDLSRTNFGLWLYKQNFRGMNEDISLIAQAGYSRELGVAYYKPWINRKQKLGIGTDVRYAERDEVVTGTNQNVRMFYSSGTGRTRSEITGNLLLTYRNHFRDRHSLEIRVRNLHISDSVRIIRSDYLPENRTTLTYAGFTYAFRLDMRDVPAYPLKGAYINLSASVRGLQFMPRGLNAGWLMADMRKYAAFSKKWFGGIGIRSRINLFQSLPYYFQEALGYSNHVRGYEYYVIDGQHFILTRSNIKYHVGTLRFHKAGLFNDARFSAPWISFYATAFADAGYVWDDYYSSANPLANSLLTGGGLGIDITSWYDWVMRVEFSVNRKGETGIFLNFTQPI